MINNKIQLIKKAKEFAKEELSIRFNPFFSIKRKPHYVIYVSEKERLSSPFKDEFKFDSYYSAQKFNESLPKRDFDTLCYKVYASNKRKKLKFCKELFNFSPESIVQVLFHEFFHNHLYLEGENLPEEHSEAFADAIGFIGSIEFSKHYYNLNQEKIIQSEKAFSEISSLVKKCTNEIKAGKANKEFYDFFEEKKKEIILKFDDYHKQRFNYELNNAFIIRYKNYCCNYISDKKYILSYKKISNFIKEGIDNFIELSIGW